MKTLRSTLLAFVAFAALAISTPAFALDPHDAQVTSTTDYSTTTTTTPQTLTILTLTTHAVNAGTNSYLISADVSYEVPSGTPLYFQLANAGTAIAGTLVKVNNAGRISIHTEVENIAASVAITLQAVVKTSTTPVKIAQADLVINGQAGATQ